MRRVPAVVLVPGRYVVGSDTQSDIRLDVAGVQPRHCLIVAGPSRAVVRAYDPRTWLNDAPVSEAPLSAGDRLTIGPIELQRMRTGSIRRLSREEVGALEELVGL